MGDTDPKDNLIRLMEQYKNLVFSVCLRLTGDYFTAEDITQETFIAAYRNYESFDGENEKAWICRIASNKCIDHKREAARRLIPTPDDEMPQETSVSGNEPLDTAVCNDLMEHFKRVCEGLPDPYRGAARGYFIEGRTAAEIAARDGTELKTVQTRIYRARQMLKTTIRKEDLLA